MVEVEVGDAVAGGASASCWARKNIWCKYLWAKRKMNQNQPHLNLPRQQLRKSPVLLSRVGRLPLAPLVLAVHLAGGLRRREGRAWKHCHSPYTTTMALKPTECGKLVSSLTGLASSKCNQLPPFYTHAV